MVEASAIRRKIIDTVVSSREGHVASSFSIVEMLIAIYLDMDTKLGRFYPENFVLSKGHASYAYYAVLHACGLMADAELSTVGMQGSKFYGHLPYIKDDKRFFFGSGSLGHGIPFALGLAMASRISGSANETYCLVGDGEANEGTFWETLLLAEKFNDAKLNILIDCNDSSERAIPITEKLMRLGAVFKGIEVVACDGHDVDAIQAALNSKSNIKLILCKTIKGYPSSLMINNPAWHHRVPNEMELASIIQDLS